MSTWALIIAILPRSWMHCWWSRSPPPPWGLRWPPWRGWHTPPLVWEQGTVCEDLGDNLHSDVTCRRWAAGSRGPWRACRAAAELSTQKYDLQHNTQHTVLMVGHSENTQVAGFMHDFIKYWIRNFVVERPLRPAPKMLNVEILNCSLVWFDQQPRPPDLDFIACY